MGVVYRYGGMQRGNVTECPRKPGLEHHLLGLCRSDNAVAAVYTHMRRDMHQSLSDFATHLRKCVRKMNRSPKGQLKGTMGLTCSVRPQS